MKKQDSKPQEEDNSKNNVKSESSECPEIDVKTSKPLVGGVTHSPSKIVEPNNYEGGVTHDLDIESKELYQIDNFIR